MTKSEIKLGKRLDLFSESWHKQQLLHSVVKHCQFNEYSFQINFYTSIAVFYVSLGSQCGRIQANSISQNISKCFFAEVTLYKWAPLEIESQVCWAIIQISYSKSP